MDELRKYMSEFDDDSDKEPLAGHFDRFEKRLTNYHNKKKRRSLPFLLKVAAIAVLVLMSGMWVFEKFNLNPQSSQQQISLQDLSPELAEAEQFFSQQVSLKFNELQSIEFNDTLERKMVMDELSEMDKVFPDLQTDLTANPGDERVVSAMIEYYQKKISILNRILNKLKNVESTNKNDHEKIEV